MAYPTSIRLRPENLEAMLEHVHSVLPYEACGILAGRAGRVLEVIPIKNIAQSPVCFKMDPQQQVETQIRIEDEGMELIGIFHSHPAGAAHPSEQDRREAAYPEAAFVVLSFQGDAWRCHAYAMHLQGPREIPILVEECETQNTRRGFSK
jgi:proteasome lid subunit RPN8/RPN11